MPGLVSGAPDRTAIQPDSSNLFSVGGADPSLVSYGAGSPNYNPSFAGGGAAPNQGPPNGLGQMGGPQIGGAPPVGGNFNGNGPAAMSPGGAPAMGEVVQTIYPKVLNFDPARGASILQVDVKRDPGAGFGFTPSQYSLADATKKARVFGSALNLAPLRKKCYWESAGIPVVDVNAFGAAGRSGLKQWDIILEVNGQSIREMTAPQAVTLLKGIDTQASLIVSRLGPPPSTPDQAVASARQYQTSHLSMYHTRSFGSTQVTPPLEKRDNGDDTISLLLELTQGDAGSLGFTPFKFSLNETKKLVLVKGFDLSGLRKECKFAKPHGRGLPVQVVQNGSPAHVAGLMAWDVLQEVGGVDIREKTCEEATSLIRQAAMAGPVRLRVLRSKNNHTFKSFSPSKKQSNAVPSVAHSPLTSSPASTITTP
mmetsp:Transcript_12132/g.28035  ORF Transcript_12132/g.28035 Transcript_12132/m.28035 type:complete len:424 (-) Transcript_12132:44-1315(-)